MGCNIIISISISIIELEGSGLTDITASIHRNTLLSAPVETLGAFYSMDFSTFAAVLKRELSLRETSPGC